MGRAASPSPSLHLGAAVIRLNAYTKVNVN